MRSTSRRTDAEYRCVTPNACSNFYVEDLGLEPIPALTIDCSVPAPGLPGRSLEARFTLRNPGTGTLPKGLGSFEIARTQRN